MCRPYLRLNGVNMETNVLVYSTDVTQWKMAGGFLQVVFQICGRAFFIK